MLGKVCWGLHHQPAPGPSPHPGARPFGHIDMETPEHWMVTSETMTSPCLAPGCPPPRGGVHAGDSRTTGAVTHSGTAACCRVRVRLSGPTRIAGSLQAPEPKPVTVKTRCPWIEGGLSAAPSWAAPSTSPVRTIGDLVLLPSDEGLGEHVDLHCKQATRPPHPQRPEDAHGSPTRLQPGFQPSH